MRTLKLMAATSAVALLAAGSAYAADPVEKEGMSLVVYGQVNYAFGFIDNDTRGGGFFVTNHAGSTTRFGLKSTGQINDDLQLGAKIELSYQETGIHTITTSNQAGVGALLELRHAYWWVKSASMGSLRVGHTDTATNGTGEIDLSGTGVADLNMTGFINGRGSVSATGRVVGFDGNGRTEVVRYDTPKIAGFSLAGSVTGDGDVDVAARYARAFGDIKIALGVGYTDFATTGSPADELITASGGIKHASGLSLTAGYGIQENQNGADTESWNIKPGFSASLNEYGPTHFAVSYGETDFDTINGTAETYAATIVQDISHLGANFYLGYRGFENAGGDEGDIFFAGARVKF